MEKRTIIQTMKLSIVIFHLSIIFPGCSNQKNDFDASGTFEATETIVSAQGNGVIKSFNINEGETLDSGAVLGYIDTIQLYLKKKQLEAQVKAMGFKLPDINAQTAQFKQQAAVTQSRLEYLLKEKSRIENLVKADAATPKQFDDISAQVTESQQQIKAINQQGAAQTSALHTLRSGISGDVAPLFIQIEQLEDQLEKSKIINPVKGTVLTKFAEADEVATIGKPLYTIADLSTIIFRAYVTGDQFSAVRPGQKVNVLVDDTSGKSKAFEGIVEWISSKAEFTPKTIQTKDERANLVYAIKVRVQNDGTLKIGMYGELKFH